MVGAPEGLGVRLRERKIVQWSVAYLAGAWLLLQVLDLLAGAYGWPPIVMRAAPLLLTIGLVAVLVLAWYHGEQGRQRVSGPELLMLATLFLIGGGVMVMLVGRRPAEAEVAPGTPAAAGAASLAVLPFTNLSADPDNAYFAGGFHDELLTHLAQIPGLKVISRTTMLRYEGSQKSIKEIAQELGVRAVMEGSVQRVGDRVRINAQLIDAATDEHLWAERFDREILDVFAVQSEVAGAVATAMKTALSPKQAAALARRPTENAEAYGLYLKGLEQKGRGLFEENYRNAERFLRRAVELDPRFAEAWAELSDAQTQIYFLGYTPTVAQLAEGRRSAEKAYALAPDLPRVRNAMGQALYRARDYEGSLAYFEPLLAETPDFPGAASGAASVYRRQGRWEEALRYYERSAEIDPGGANGVFQIGVTLQVLRRFDEANVPMDRVIELEPEGASNFYLARAGSALRASGDLAAARAVVARMPNRFSDFKGLALAWLDLAGGVPQDAFAHLASVSAETRLGGGQGTFGMMAADRALLEGLALARMGRPSEARDRFQKSASSLEAIVNASGFDPRTQLAYLSALALDYAGLGQKELAIATVERSARELPVSLDALFGPGRFVDEAQVFALVGEKDRAVAALREALAHPIADTPAFFRLDPLLSSLKGYEPFERLMREQEGR